MEQPSCAEAMKFLLTPLREGRPWKRRRMETETYFYSRPCGRGDKWADVEAQEDLEFLLTPLREGRLVERRVCIERVEQFLLTPLREGRQQFSTSPS